MVTAVDRKNLLDAIVFPATGFHDIPNQCIGADLMVTIFTYVYLNYYSHMVLNYL